MGKGKQKKKSENKANIPSSQKIVLHEIDYDKLAEAIAKANNKQQEEYSPSREWMKYILTPFFWGVAVISGILSVAMFISLIQNINEIFDNGTIIEIAMFLFKFSLTLFIAGFCIFSIVVKKEIEKEKDRTYVATIFSNTIAIIALAVAVIAL